MSLEIVRAVDRSFPALLQQNINRTCYEFVVEVIKRLKAAGHQAYHVCKSPGEGQYTPPGFRPRAVVGLDGKTYQCSGVSHDAIWCDGVIVDTIARGNDSPDPIGMTGEPVWNLIPREHWRANNPPLTDAGPTQPPPGQSTVPGREEALNELNWLDAYYMAPEGLQREQGLSLNGAPDFEGVAAWYLDVYQKARIAGKSRADARAEYVAQIRHSAEWMAKHPGQTP